MPRRQRARDQERRTALRLAGQFALGAALGAVFAMLLLWRDSFGLSDLIASSEAPRTLQLLFVIGIAFHFALGAALTAFLMLASDD